MDVVKTGDTILKLLRALTWKRIAQIGVLSLIFIVIQIVWIDREYLAGRIQPSKLSIDNAPLELKDVSTAAIGKILTEKRTTISSVGIISVNAQGNTRKVIYFDSNDRDLLNKYKEDVENRVTQDVPLFSSNTVDNTVIIRLLNGELVCRPWAESVASRYLKNVDVRYVCSVGVPPEYGRFRGIVMVFLRVDPDEYEGHRIRVMLKDLSFKLDKHKDS